MDSELNKEQMKTLQTQNQLVGFIGLQNSASENPIYIHSAGNNTAKRLNPNPTLSPIKFSRCCIFKLKRFVEHRFHVCRFRRQRGGVPGQNTRVPPMGRHMPQQHCPGGHVSSRAIVVSDVTCLKRYNLLATATWLIIIDFIIDRCKL